MRLERITGVLVLAAAAVAGGASAADPTPAAPPKVSPHQQQGAPKPKSDEPSADHKLLASFVGHWKSTVHYLQSDPAAANPTPPQDSQGAADGKLELGGRFVELAHTGVLNGQPYEGKILVGFDDVIKKYTAIWRDTTSPAFLSYFGTYNAAKKQYSLEAHFSDQVTRKFIVSHLTMTFVDADTMVFDEFVSHTVGGAEVHTRTITFKRG
jgi:hypothetical protein